jgi:hypothetical protein
MSLESEVVSSFIGLTPDSGLRTSDSDWWLWVELDHQPRAYETLALIHLSYTAVKDFGSPRRS